MTNKIELTVVLLIILSAVFAAAGYWEPLGLSGRQVLSVETNPLNSQYICAGTDSGMYVSFDGGASWNHRMGNDTIPFLSYDPHASNTIVALVSGSYSGGLYSSTNNGNSWNLVSYLDNPRRLGFDLVSPGFIYICFNNGILKSQDGGLNFSDANEGLPDLNIIDVKGDGANQFEAYAVGETFVAHTTDFANNWADIGGLFGLEDYNPNRIEYEPNGQETLYVSCWAYVAVSFDGGLSWQYTHTSTIANVPITCDPQIAGRLFVGSVYNGGVLISTDAGASFTPLNDSLGDLNVHSLEVDAQGNLLAGTEDGIYVYDFSSSVIDTCPVLPSSTVLYQNYPNPFNNRTLIEFATKGPGNTRLEIYDITGKTVKILFDGSADGYRAFWWDGTDRYGNRVSSGIYIYSLKTADQAIYRKMTLLK